MPAATTTQDPTNLSNIKAGDCVALVRNTSKNRDRIQGLHTVMMVEETKRGPKVTLTDGTSWDAKGWGRAWGTRTQTYYTGLSLCMATPEILEALEYQRGR